MRGGRLDVTGRIERTDGRKNTPLLCLTLAMASLGVSWAGRLRVRHSHDGLASGRASETRGCPLAGRDLHGNPLHTDLCFWRLLLALCAITMPEAVLGECVAVLRRQWIEPRRRLHRCAAAAHRPLHACSPASRRKRAFPSVSSSLPVRKCNRICPSGQVKLCLS